MTFFVRKESIVDKQEAKTRLKISRERERFATALAAKEAH